MIKKQTASSRLISNFTIILIIIACLISFAPYFWTFLSGFKQRTDILATTPKLFFTPTLENFPEVFIKNGFINYLRNSVLTALLTVALSLLVGVPCAYAFSRFHIFGKKHLFFYFLTTRMCPGVAEALPLYIMFSKLGLLGTTVGLTLAHCTFNVAFVIYVMRSFFDDIPTELDHAALVDGYGEFGTFWHAILPVVKPGIASTALLAFIFSWNEMLFGLILGGQAAKTLPAAFSGLITPHGTFWGQLCAAAGVVTLPVIILAIFLQNYLIQGLSLGSVKG